MSDQHAPSASYSPLVSILIVARNTGALIGDALLSARQQTFTDIEVVVVDDGSTDDTRMVADTHAALDPRVRVLAGPQQGLAAVRNASLLAARGRWVAILDSDDLLHPTHVERLVAAAERTGAELVAANMINFAVDRGITSTSLFADGASWREERDLDLLGYIRANGAVAGGVVTGYLKPLISSAFLRDHGISYDTRLRIAEDYDIVARALAAGARYLFVPRPTYFYRRHANSTSHRLSVADLMGMLAASGSEMRARDAAVAGAIARRKRAIRSALAHARAIDALKARRGAAAVRALGIDMGAWLALARSAIEGGQRRLRRQGDATPNGSAPEPVVLVIGDAGTGSTLATATAGESRTMAHRAAPRDDAARAAIADGLPPVARILIAAPATVDDAAYAMAPDIVREVLSDPMVDATPKGSAAATG